MKNILSFILYVFIVILALTPSLSKDVISNSLNLCMYTLVPVIFPFISLTSLMISYKLYEPIAKLFYPILHKLFGVSLNGCFAVIIGFTCGYPMGIKISYDLYSSKQISYDEYIYLVSFTNNVSIGFLFGFIHTIVLQRKIPAPILLAITYMPSIITGLILKKHNFSSIPKTNKASTFASPISNSITSICTICFYTISCSIISDYLYFFFNRNIFVCRYIIPFIEITKGLTFISSTGDYSFSQKILISTIATITGGFCITIQSYLFSKNTNSLKHYIKGKSFSCLISVSLIYLYSLYVHLPDYL